MVPQVKVGRVELPGDLQPVRSSMMTDRLPDLISPSRIRKAGARSKSLEATRGRSAGAIREPMLRRDFHGSRDEKVGRGYIRALPAVGFRRIKAGSHHGPDARCGQACGQRAGAPTRKAPRDRGACQFTGTWGSLRGVPGVKRRCAGDGSTWVVTGSSPARGAPGASISRSGLRHRRLWRRYSPETTGATRRRAAQYSGLSDVSRSLPWIT